MLPIDPILPDLVQTLRDYGRAVLQAPPGAGKTTRVPLAFLDAVPGKIIMLEPRRIAARSAAARLAQQLGEDLGKRIGYRMRGDSKPGSRIEVITDGILTRMIQSDPELNGIGALIFDEFHERALAADLGLALALEIRGALRPDLALLVMSATLDAAPVATLMDDAPMLTAEGRSFPVEILYQDRPRKGRSLIPDIAALTRTALRETEGGVLIFLPGAREIRQLQGALREQVSDDVSIMPLYGALPFAQQQAAIAPLGMGRKVVLATSIAETSLTIEDIRVVIDSGLSRRARFDPGTGMSRLVTQPASRAEITQRAGRAGRVAAGRCYRNWAKAEEGALPAFAPPEIANADLSGLALELALWGAQDLPFLTSPPDGAMAEARRLLVDLGALDTGDAITAHGRMIARLPLHPRLAQMLATAGPAAAPLAALLSDRDPMPQAGADLARRVAALTDPHRAAPQERPALKRIAAEAQRLARHVRDVPEAGLSPPQWAALAYPDRIGLRRPGDDPRWLLSGGRGARMTAQDDLAAARLIVATELDGAGTDARIRHAIAISERELRDVHGARISWHDHCAWSRQTKRVIAEQQERIGTLVLASRRWNPPADTAARAMLDGVRQLGLPHSAASDRLRDRVALVRSAGHDLPDMSDAALLESAEDWMLPYLHGITSAGALAQLDLRKAFEAMLSWEQSQILDREAPVHFTTALGRKVTVNYTNDGPEIAVRLQEMFGVTRHPMIAGRPAKIVLLSPAQRPVQVTTDLPGFWRSSYADVRKDMRGRYPKHPWPEDPMHAQPTLRAKPRGS